MNPKALETVLADGAQGDPATAWELADETKPAPSRAPAAHPADCRGDCCHYDQLTDDLAAGFLTDDPDWTPPTRENLNRLRKTSRPITPAAANPAPT